MAECVHELEESTCSWCSGAEKMPRSRGRRGGMASAHFDVGFVLLETPYDEEFVASLKAALPSYARRWEPQDRVWKISSEFWEAAAGVVEEYFDLVE